MSKYNKTKVAPVVATVTTHQGGTGFALKPELELMSLLANGIKDTFYEKETEQDKRLANLINQLAKQDAILVAKMLIYTRAKIGQRSVTHRGAVELAKYMSGADWGKYFFDKRSRNGNAGGIVYRLDDILEIVACYAALNPSPTKRKDGKKTLRLPNSMKKGFKAALEQADEYEIAKYQGNTKEISLIDVVNLVHPTPTSKNANAFKKLMKGELTQFNTIEDKNTKAGQEVAAKVKEGEITEAEAKVELAKAKETNFKELVEDKVLGYLALIRNLRNIIQNTKDASLIKGVCDQLTDEKAIKKSLIFPHQIDLALEMLLVEGYDARAFIKSLNDAYELSIPNLSELGAHGRTAVVYDESGSMTSYKSFIAPGKTCSNAIAKAALITATLAKGLGADVYSFDSSCRKRSYNQGDTVNTLKNNFLVANGGGTNFSSIFPALTDRYDRIFIISDEQGSDKLGLTVENYKKKFGVDPYIYCINLNGYGTTMFKPSSKVFQVFGYSAEIYEIIKKYEVDYNTLLNEVKKIEFIPSEGAIARVATKKKEKKETRKPLGNLKKIS